MRGVRLLVAATVATLALGASAAAEELEFNRLIVLGDSLSDEGAYSQSVFLGSGGALPNINYRFTTNAPDGSSRTYAGFLAQKLGVDDRPNLITGVPAAGAPDISVGGDNYAQGGSRVSDPAGIGFNAAGGVTTAPVSGQVDRLLADGATLRDTDLVVVWAGSNDVFAQSGAVGAGALTPTDAVVNMAAAADDLVAEVDRLKAAGAKTVLVVTVPDIGTTPFGLGAEAATPGTGALLTTLSGTFNDQLTSGLRGKNVVIVDSQKLLGAVAADPARYGFDAPNAATGIACPNNNSLTCVQGVNADPNSEEFIFADGVHPTTAAHELFGEAAFAGLQAGTQTGAISVAALTALRQQALGLENRLTPSVMVLKDEAGAKVRRQVGDVDVFGGVDFGYYETDGSQVTPGLEGATQIVKIGFDVAVAPNATIGAGFSVDHGQVDFDDDLGGFDTRLFVGAAFGQVSLTKNFYLNAAGGGGYVDVYNINRSFQLGESEESYDASSEGTYVFGRFGGGVMAPITPELTLNPFAHFTYERVDIDGYTESDGAASLSFGDTEYESHRVSGGLSAWYAPSALPWFTLNLRGSVEHDLLDDDLTVPLGPDEDLLAEVSAPRPDQTWGYVAGQALIATGAGSFLSLGASGSVGLDGTTGIVGTLNYKIAF